MEIQASDEWEISYLLPSNSPLREQSKPSATRAYYVTLLLVLVAILIPIWIVDYPGLVDYPNHLTRCYILAHYNENPIWQQRFYLDLTPLPNLSVDLIVVPLLHFLPLLVCGKIFLSLAAAIYLFGCSAVGRVLSGKPNWLALLCAFTFYNEQLLDGFLNYTLGLGIFLCAFAFWFHIRNAITPLRFGVCCILSIVAFLAHLSSIMFLGVACVTVALIESVRGRTFAGFLVKVAWLVCPLVLMLSYMKGSGHGGLIRLGVHSKLTNLVAPLSSYDPKLDIAIAIVLLVCALTLIRRSRIRFTVFVCVVFMILYFITPSEILTASHVDERYIVPSVLFLVLSIDPNRFRLQKMAFWLALTMMVIRTGFIGANWLSISRHSEQVLAMERVLPREARIYALPPDNPSIGLSERGFIHVIQYWTLTRDANISTLFALPGQQPLVFRQSPCEGPEWAQCFSRYDYVWTLDPPPAIEQVLFRIATPAAAYEKVTLWRVNQPLAF